MCCLEKQFPLFEQQLHSCSSLSFFRRSLLGKPLIPTKYVLTKTQNHAAIPSFYQSGMEASRQHKTPMVKTRNSGKSATTPTPMQTPSTDLSQSLISARRALLMQQEHRPTLTMTLRPDRSPQLQNILRPVHNCSATAIPRPSLPPDPFPACSARPGWRLDTTTPTLKAHAAVALPRPTARGAAAGGRRGRGVDC
jgi:hypothetical protein